ncbi:glycosyltransferase family A protein, partial [Helicobacter sp. CLO-3]
PPPQKNLDALDVLNANNATNHLATNQTNNIPEIVVSFTSYPARINQVHYTIYSILTQTYKPNRVVLYLSAQEFPNKLDDLPQKLLAFCKHGLEIRFVEQNYRSYKKIIYALKDFPESIIITIDDDVFYSPFIIERLILSYREMPNVIHCNWVVRVAFDENYNLMPYMSWNDIYDTMPSILNSQVGICGVLYPPHCLHKSIFDSEKFLKLSPMADDIWIWAMALLNDTKIRKVLNCDTHTITKHSSQDSALWKTNCGMGHNDIFLKNVLDYFPEIREKLLDEAKQVNQV